MDKKSPQIESRRAADTVGIIRMKKTLRDKKKLTSKNKLDVENNGFDVEGKKKRKIAKK